MNFNTRGVIFAAENLSYPNLACLMPHSLTKFNDIHVFGCAFVELLVQFLYFGNTPNKILTVAFGLGGEGTPKTRNVSP